MVIHMAAFFHGRLLKGQSAVLAYALVRDSELCERMR